jgi:hypothetical protein
MDEQGLESVEQPEVMTLVQSEDDSAALTADVNRIPLASILGLLHADQLSGLLVFETEDLEKSVFLHSGEVVFAASNHAADRLGESLVRAGMLTPEQFRKATSSYKPGVRFGKTLVELGFLSPRELWTGVRIQVEEIVRSLFSYTEGQVRFCEGAFAPDNVVRLALPMQRLVSEGLAHREELQKFLEHLKRPEVLLESVPQVQSSLSPEDRSFLNIFATETRFSEACDQMGWDALSGADHVQQLKKMGAIKIFKQDPIDFGEDDFAEQEDLRIRELVTEYSKLLGELVMPIVALEGGEGIRIRMTDVLADTARNHAALLGGISVGPCGMLNPEPIIERALKMGGDREEIIAVAMGELVAYLEFELKNHPSISSAEAILDGICDLRAKIGMPAPGQI